MRFFYTLIFLLLFSSMLFSQGIQTTFGKNRVQYHEFVWTQYESENFITYWYEGGKELGKAAAMIAETEYTEVQNLLEYRVNARIELLVYSDLTDLKQSNVGNEEIFYNTGGVTKIVGNKIFVYFDGDHRHLQQQIREGIARVFVNYMMFGGSIQEIVQNAVLLNLPPWFTEGMVSFAGKKWDVDLDDQMRDAILSQNVNNFNDLVKINPQLAGHSMWYYIEQNFGSSTVSNLLYLTRINRSVESGFLYVLGKPFSRLSENWIDFYAQKYQLDDVAFFTIPEEELLQIKNKKNATFREVKISPSSKQIAYVTNDKGKFRVYLYDKETEKHKLILKGGIKNIFQSTDLNYPLLSWSKNNKDLAIIYEKRDVIKIKIIDTKESKTILDDVIPEVYHRITSADFITNNQMVFSAMAQGYSDIFLYNLKTRSSNRITQDQFDDKDAIYGEINGQKGILFASNREDSLIRSSRIDTLLPLGEYDLYFYNLTTKSKILFRVTNTPEVDESFPNFTTENRFSYLSGKSGIINRYTGKIDTVFSYDQQVFNLSNGSQIIIPIDSVLDASVENIDSQYIESIFIPQVFSWANSNSGKNIRSQSTTSRTQTSASLIRNGGKEMIWIQQLNPEKSYDLAFTSFKKLAQNIASPPDQIEDENENIFFENEEEPKSKTEQEGDSGKIDIDNYFFQSDFDNNEMPEAAVIVEHQDGSVSLQRPNTAGENINALQKDPIHRFRRNMVTTYRLKFKTDYVTTQMDNSLLFGGLDSYTSEGQAFGFRPLGILVKGSVTDIFEDYRITGGVRVPTSFNGAEYFVTIEDVKSKIDKSYSFYRSGITDDSNIGTVTLSTGLPTFNPVVKNVTDLGQFEAKYPLDIFTSIRGRAFYRMDKQFYLARDVGSLNEPINREQRFGLHIEYVYDNTFDVSMNMKNGTRYKVFVEMQKKFNLQLEDGFEFDVNKGFLTVIALDARHYQPLDKYTILAGRVAGASSFGSEKILYFMGGVDNWLFPKYNDNVPVPEEDEFAFQTLASNMRGFRSNIRNGNSYALANFELRSAFVNYITKNPTKNSFLRNLQAVGFLDVGTAWQGLSPFNDENPLNTDNVGNPPVTVKVNYFRDPVILGFGGGLRSTVFGYFVRLDYAWGLETGVIQDPILYLSLGLDF